MHCTPTPACPPFTYRLLIHRQSPDIDNLSIFLLLKRWPVGQGTVLYDCNGLRLGDIAILVDYIYSGIATVGISRIAPAHPLQCWVMEEK